MLANAQPQIFYLEDSVLTNEVYDVVTYQLLYWSIIYSRSSRAPAAHVPSEEEAAATGKYSINLYKNTFTSRIIISTILEYHTHGSRPTESKTFHIRLQ